jgi:predicted transcriptional regulator
MLLHIHTRRQMALSLIERGIITPAEAAKLLGESRQAVHYIAREIDQKAARANFLDELWRNETERVVRKKVASNNAAHKRKDVLQ